MEFPIESLSKVTVLSEACDAVVLIPGTRLNALSAPGFKRFAAVQIRSGVSQLILDFSLVRQIDVSGLAAVRALDRSARAVGSRVVSRGASPEVQRAFELTGMAFLAAGE